MRSDNEENNARPVTEGLRWRPGEPQCEQLDDELCNGQL